MKLSEFCTKYQGQKVDFDKVCGAQCVDLARQYMQEVYQIPRTEGLGENGGAKDLWLRYDEFPLEKQYLQKVDYLQSGDIVVFDATPNNKFGHVAILVGKQGDQLLCFEQNGFTQDGAKYTWRSTENLLGGLRCRN
jgi:hypothetical protein